MVSDKERTLGGRVEIAIQRTGLAHNEFARRAGVFTSVLSRWKADQQPTLGKRSGDVLAKIAKAGGVDLAWLAGQPTAPAEPQATDRDEDERYPSKVPAARVLRGLVDDEAIEAMLSEEHKGTTEDPGAEFWIQRARWWQARRDEIKTGKPTPPDAIDEPPPLQGRPRERSGTVPVDRAKIRRLTKRVG